jgi:hypothetical protein
MLKRRSRIVSFRLSDEEYNSLKNVSATCGARSVSEFTRSVACRNNAAENHDQNNRLEESIGEILRMLADRMEALDSRIQTLTDRIKNKNTSDAAEPTAKKDPVE